MYLNKLLLKDFGKFHNKDIDLKPGVNLVYGPNEAGKTTIKEFIVGMLYGIDKSRGLGAKCDNYELRKPLNGSNYAGKAYINHDGNTYLIERSFLRNNRKTSVINAQTAMELKLKDKNSLQKTMFDLDKSTYINTLCIGEQGAAVGKELADEMANYLGNLATTGSADIDKAAAIERLKEERKKYDSKDLSDKLDNISVEISNYKDVEDKLKEVRKEIVELDEAFAMETARRKREARKLIENEQGVTYEDNEELNEDLDQIAKQAVFLDADIMKDYKPKKPITDNIWVILGTGVFVIAVIALMVNILPFEQGVRQVFIFCTFLFVVVTIVEGLYAKGVFSGEAAMPSEEEFKRMIYDLERKTEAYSDVEIDMSFAQEYADKKSQLRVVEKELLEKKTRREDLEEEFNIISGKKKDLDKEVHAINLAINTINEVSAQIHGDRSFLINDNISDIVSKITDGKYQDVKLDENLHVMVKDNDSYVGIEYLSAGTIEQIYLAVRLSIARLLCRDKMPLIIDDIFTNYDEARLVNTLDCLKTIDTEQIILMTSNSHIGDMLDDLDMEYNYVELA